MQNETESTVFALSKADKEKALEAIVNGIQQLQWQKEFYEMQINALPELPEDASVEEKQGRARQMVQLDAMEKKVEDQVTFYQFCKNQI
jgi:hypothetical protein